MPSSDALPPPAFVAVCEALGSRVACSEAKLRSLYANTPAMMHSIDRQGRIVDVSNLWLERLGYRREDVIGRKSVEFLTPESRRYAEEVVLPQFFAVGTCQDVPYQFVRRDGTVADILLSATAIRDEDGNVMQSLAVLQDVTEQIRVERERRELYLREQAARAEADSAREVERLKDALLETVSHEFRTPLTTIWGFAELLRGDVGPPGSRQRESYVNHIVESTKRLRRLVGALLDSASIEAGVFQLEPDRADFRELVEVVVSSLQPQLAAASLTLALELPPGPMDITMDSDRIGQVLLNFLGNAMKFTPAGGSIVVRASFEGDTLRCAVRDTGEGIAEADLPKLFDRFSRLKSLQRRHGGTGLGLSISKAIVTGHGGDIGVHSELGAGSEFWFTLPREGAGALLAQ